MRNELGTDIALLNAGNIRGFFINGDIDVRRINDITPFEDKMTICELPEKQIVEAIKVGAKSFLSEDHPQWTILSELSRVLKYEHSVLITCFGVPYTLIQFPG
jgi:hypothetical protein